MTGDAANNAAAAIAITDSVFFMFVVVLVCRCLLFDFPAADHFLSAVRIGDSCRCLHPILVLHRAMRDVVAALSRSELDCFVAEFANTARPSSSGLLLLKSTPSATRSSPAFFAPARSSATNALWALP